ncbi:MAG TPA: hypothetical protein VGE66_01250 [Chitinophagaceae bacterium]
MHFLKGFLLITLITLGVVSCTKEKTDPPAADLTGVWQWVRSDGGIGNNIHYTPATTGKQVTLKLTADRQFFFYSHGVLTSQGTYTLENGTCIHDGKQKTRINFSSCPDQMIHLLEDKSLHLSDEAHDGISSQYSRAEMSIYQPK